MRLIDADRLITTLKKYSDDMCCSLWNDIICTINEQSTAYDIDKVCKGISNIKVGGDCRHSCKHYDWSVGACKGLCERYVKDKAIEIVGRGRVNAEY